MRGTASFIAAGAVAALATAGIAAPAYAANASLAVATASLPSDTELVATVDLTQLRSTKLYGSIVPTLLSSASGGSVQTGIDKVKKTCGFDPMTAIDSATIASDTGRDAAGFFGMSITEKQFTSCIVALGTTKNGSAISTSKSGDEIVISGGGKTFYVSWLKGDVLAITAHPEDEKLLSHFTTGAGALAQNTALTGWMAKLDPNALLALASVRAVTHGSVTMSGAAMSLTYRSGTFNLEGTIDVGSKATAKSIEDGADFIKSFVKMGPPELATVAKTVVVKANGTEVSAKASATETDLTAIASWAAKNLPSSP